MISQIPIPSPYMHNVFIRFFFLMVLATTSVLVTANICQPFPHFLKGQFERFVMYQRRGVPDSIVKSHYCDVVDGLLHVVQENYPKVVRLNAAWICQTEVDKLTSRVSLNDIDAYVNRVLLMDQYSFYLRSSHYTSGRLALSLVQQRLLDNVWKTVEREMTRRPFHVRTDVVCSLPKAIRIFYDPVGPKLREEFNRKLTAGGKIISAEENLYQATALAARLKLLNPNDDSHNVILRHCIAHNFLTMRATRLEGNELFVPNNYIAAYNAYFEKSTKELNVSSVPPFSIDIIRDHFAAVLQPLIEFDMGTKLVLLVDDNRGNALLRSVTNKILTPGRLVQLLKASNDAFRIESTSELDLVNVISAENFYGENKSWTTRQSGNCGDGFEEYPANVNIDCCASMCLTADLTLTGFSEDECCEDCNSVSCDLDNDVVGKSVDIEIDPMTTAEPIIVTL